VLKVRAAEIVSRIGLAVESERDLLDRFCAGFVLDCF